ACAEFFKRAKTSGKTFVCRQGDFSCTIVKDEKFTCRRCRYDRCVQAGMMYEKAPKKEEKPIDMSDSSNSDAPSTSRDQQESILERIGRLFNASVDRRRTQELQLLQDRPDLKLAPHPTQKMYVSNFASSARIFEITMAETRSFYEEAFPEITKLTSEEQDLLTRSYIPKFCFIDNGYRTRKIWGEIDRLSV
ncbi:hypothetical protein PFISCL1PPCAC_13698, partial [Pristionchus fissidentatus]